MHTGKPRAQHMQEKVHPAQLPCLAPSTPQTCSPARFLFSSFLLPAQHSFPIPGSQRNPTTGPRILIPQWHTHFFPPPCSLTDLGRPIPLGSRPANWFQGMLPSSQGGAAFDEPGGFGGEGCIKDPHQNVSSVFPGISIQRMYLYGYVIFHFFYLFIYSFFLPSTPWPSHHQNGGMGCCRKEHYH